MDSCTEFCAHSGRSTRRGRAPPRLPAAAIIGAMSVSRRRLLCLSLGAALPIAPARAQQPRSLRDPLRVGADSALFDSGLAKTLVLAFGRDTGLAVKLVPLPALPLLDALERGELDAALSNAPEAETRLERLGLAHDRQPIAGGEFVLIGPAPRRKERDPAAIAGQRNAAEALVQLSLGAQALPGSITFLSAGDGSGAHVLEQMLWRQARQAPAAPWYAVADSHSSLIAQARARGAYALVERGAWAVQGGAPLAVLVEGDALLAEQVHVLRAFRAIHPAGKIFVEWIAGARGRRLVAAQRGYRVVA
jgi:tungstate transport system substrate-binding protein